MSKHANKLKYNQKFDPRKLWGLGGAKLPLAICRLPVGAIDYSSRTRQTSNYERHCTGQLSDKQTNKQNFLQRKLNGRNVWVGEVGTSL